jgi:hypothetical protein
MELSLAVVPASWSAPQAQARAVLGPVSSAPQRPSSTLKVLLPGHLPERASALAMEWVPQQHPTQGLAAAPDWRLALDLAANLVLQVQLT